MAQSAHILLILTLTLGILPQEGWGSSLSGEQPGGVARAAPRRIRAKRCSCNNPLDSECHYFCHLDIIWVNTPGKTTIYGLGSPLSRRRRSAHRCACANPADRTCAAFCQSSSENASLLLVNPSTRFPDDLGRASSNLLASLRDAAHTNGWITHQGISTRKKPARDRKLRDR